MKRRLSIPTDRAAYQASQSLFDALRTGCERLQEPLNVLKTTRDLSQRIHVQVDKPAAKQCIAYSLQSLTQTLQVHGEILTQLAEICKPTPTEPTARPTYRLLNKLQRQLASASETLQSDAMINAVRPAPSPDATKKRKTDMPDRSLDSPTNDAVTASDAPVPSVQYTDVTAEIEARLLAKELKRKAKKESKKRKRESMESIGSLVEQPSTKKKARVNEVVNGQEGTVVKPDLQANGHAQEVVRVKRKQRRSESGEHGFEKDAASKPRKRVKTH